jgi:hypothetical protein
MLKRRLLLLNHCGQILVEALVTCMLMAVIMVAFAKLIEMKKSRQKNYNNIQQKLEELHAKSVQNKPTK